MHFEVFLRKYIFGNPLSIGVYSNGEQAWEQYERVSRLLKDGYGVYIELRMRNSVHVIAETNKW